MKDSTSLTTCGNGLLPFSVLFASSIVQDGHGMLPLLVHPRRDFVLVKLIHLIVALPIGAAMLLAGWWRRTQIDGHRS